MDNWGDRIKDFLLGRAVPESTQIECFEKLKTIILERVNPNGQDLEDYRALVKDALEIGRFSGLYHNIPQSQKDELMRMIDDRLYNGANGDSEQTQSNGANSLEQ